MEMDEEWGTLYVYCLITLMNVDGSLFDNSELVLVDPYFKHSVLCVYIINSLELRFCGWLIICLWFLLNCLWFLPCLGLVSVCD